MQSLNTSRKYNIKMFNLYLYDTKTNKDVCEMYDDIGQVLNRLASLPDNFRPMFYELRKSKNVLYKNVRYTHDRDPN